MRNEAALEMHEVDREFASRNGPVEAVRSLSLSIGRGEVLGVLGPNGAGKTTTIKMAATLLVPTRGRVRVAGVDAVAHPREARRHIGLVLGGDRGFYMRANAQENLAFFAELQGVRKGRAARVARVLEEVGLADKAKVRVETFSRGMKQRLHIARALLADPPLVLLDEPSIGLDPEGAQELRTLIRRLREDRRGILLTTHYLNEAEDLSDRLMVIADGSVVAEGTSSDIAALAGLSTVSSLAIQSVGDPRKLLNAVSHIADASARYKNGIWSLDVIWSDQRAHVNGLVDALSTCTIISHTERPASLEETYLAFLHRRRNASADVASEPQ